MQSSTTLKRASTAGAVDEVVIDRLPETLGQQQNVASGTKGPGPVKSWYGWGPEKACDDVLLDTRCMYSAVGADCDFVFQSLILLGAIKN